MGSVRPSAAAARVRWPMLAAGLPDLVVGVLLSVVVFMIVHVDFYASDPHGDVAAGLAATLITLPVVWARRYPLPAAAVMAAAALLNWIVVGHYIRCGAAVPAAFWVACVVGLRLRGRAAVAGMILVIAGLSMLCLGDAALTPTAIVPLTPIAVAFWFAGRAIRVRDQTVRHIAEQNRQLIATRERTAQLAVETDRHRIGAGLDAQLQRRIETMAATATSGREQVEDPASAQAAFAAISADGRATLARMREVVDTLRSDAPRGPQPGLGGLADLVARHGGRLVVDGDRRALPDGVELSGYRIVEQLLRSFDTRAETIADPVVVRVHYGADELELRISGLGPDDPWAVPEVAVAQQRIAVHGGQLAADRRNNRVQWAARIPLTSG